MRTGPSIFLINLMLVNFDLVFHDALVRRGLIVRNVAPGFLPREGLLVGVADIAAGEGGVGAGLVRGRLVPVS